MNIKIKPLRMKYLLSLPANAAENFLQLNNKSSEKWFCTSDPENKRLGSGGGTIWLLEQCFEDEARTESFENWLSTEKRILIHAGGQSRRLPAYAATGKTGIPIPVFRWARGQKLSQDLLTLQLPLYEAILSQSPESLNTLIASGDVYIRSEESLPNIPDADVVCYGLWVDSSTASRHGVFASKRGRVDSLDFMLQKPSLQTLESLSQSHYFLMDIGIWLLSDKAVQILRRRSCNHANELSFYDLYGTFGLALGENPQKQDEAVNQLSVKIIPLQKGEFYHFGTSREIISSSSAIQEKVHDQRLIMHRKIKPNSSIFTQNAEIQITFSEKNHNIWIENSFIGSKWQVSSNNIVTGVPQNNWEIELADGICVDFVPVGTTSHVIRPYGINDAFSGDINSKDTYWMNQSLAKWLNARALSVDGIGAENIDIQSAKLFPQTENHEDALILLKWMIDDHFQSDHAKKLWMNARRYSADELMHEVSLQRSYGQREALRKSNYQALEKNHEKSVFYQLDLTDVAQDYHRFNLAAPEILTEENDEMRQIHNRMLRSQIFQLSGNLEKAASEESESFSILRKEMIAAIANRKRNPQLSIFSDQIVWGRSPVRIDLAGGWTDTPPFSLFSGGNVVNASIELNGQPPLQVYVRPLQKYQIVLRSIDMGDRELIENFDELRNYKKLGSPFSIPKAALALCGFLPEFCQEKHQSLNEQLRSFGSGIEVTLLAAIPAGSGLGTSSILASTVLGALNDFCSLNWDKNEISTNTLILEQLLTSGGGWQDQYGGIFHGVKLLQSDRGFVQKPQISWLPDYLFTNSLYNSCHLLYYTGITRVAKNILGEIVKGMFLNSAKHLHILEEMKMHATDMSLCIQKGDFEAYGQLILKTWQQKKQIDSGTNPPEIEKIISQIKDYCLGYKLPGAGGGGYLYMVAKDADAAARIKKILTENPPNNKARFVDMSISDQGFQVTRS